MILYWLETWSLTLRGDIDREYLGEYLNITGEVIIIIIIIIIIAGVKFARK
jgi:hypothetical protein